MLIFPIKQGEGKWFEFLVEEAGVPVDLSVAGLRFSVKKNLEDLAPWYEKATASFDVSLAEDGKVSVNLPATETVRMDPGIYRAEFRVVLVANTDVDKSETFLIKILPAVAT